MEIIAERTERLETRKLRDLGVTGRGGASLTSRVSSESDLGLGGVTEGSRSPRVDDLHINLKTIKQVDVMWENDCEGGTDKISEQQGLVTLAKLGSILTPLMKTGSEARRMVKVRLPSVEAVSIL